MRVAIYSIILLAITIATPVLYLLATADYPGATLFYGVQEDEPIVDALLNISNLIR